MKPLRFDRVYVRKWNGRWVVSHRKRGRCRPGQMKVARSKAAYLVRSGFLR